MKNLLFILLICITIGNSIIAQNPVCRYITNQNGLPSNTVYNILQDSKGFIWLAHDKGLSRYDGNTFLNYLAPAQQAKSVSNLLEINNTIWCQDFSGNFYYTKNESLNREANFKISGNYSAAGVLKSNILTVINYDSICSFNISKIIKNALPSLGNVKQAVYHGGDFSYFFSINALKSYDGQNVNTIQTFAKPLPSFSFLIKTSKSFIAFTRNTYPLVYKVNDRDVEPLSILRSGLLIQEVSIIDKEIWVSTTSGAYCFDEDMQPLYNGQCFFAENSITKIIKDRENNYWFGTLNKGILIVPDINVKLYKYGSESITALSSYNSSNEVLAGTSSNLIFSFNNQSKQFNTLVSNEIKGEIYSLFYDKPLQKIIACSNTISFYKNGIKVNEEPLAGKSITKISENFYGIALAGGVLLQNRLSGKSGLPPWLSGSVISADNRFFLTQGFRGRSVFYDTATSTLYTATAEGLKFYNETGSKFILLNNRPIYASSLCAANGNIYAGTFSDGLVKITNNNAELLNLKYKNLASTIYKLSADSNNIWLISDELIQKYNSITGSIINYTTADGLPRAELKDILVQGTKVYLATTDGLVIFESNKNAINTTKPLLQLNKILVNDKAMPIGNISSLKSSENNIELIFSVLAFKDNAAATLSYKINSEDWKNLPKGIRNLQLASLAPGKYNIEIKATNEDGINAEKNIFVAFTIALPFYKQSWFYALIAGFILLGMYIYFQVKLRNEKYNTELLEQKMKLEKELQQSLLSSIKSQMNPHFLFNALNTIQSYIYTNEKESASLYLGKFSELTRTILDMSNKEKVNLAEEINALQLYVELEKLRFEDKLSYTFDIDKNISTETTTIPSMLIQPYVENAIKHGLMHQKSQWKLLIGFKLKGTNIEVTIDDNGVGRLASEAINKQRNKTHKSFATDANEKRLDILNKGLSENISLTFIDKKDENGFASGTTVILNIPFMQYS